MSQEHGTPASTAYTLTLVKDGQTIASIQNVSYSTAQAAYPAMLADHVATSTYDDAKVRRDALDYWDDIDSVEHVTYRGVTAVLQASN